MRSMAQIDGAANDDIGNGVNRYGAMQRAGAGFFICVRLQSVYGTNVVSHRLRFLDEVEDGRLEERMRDGREVVAAGQGDGTAVRKMRRQFVRAAR
jgi:hypothetical protein